MKKLLAILVESGDIVEEKFCKVVEYFYYTCLQYGEKWKSSWGNTEKFKWILLKKTPGWKEIHDSINEKTLTYTQRKKLVYSISGS